MLPPSAFAVRAARTRKPDARPHCPFASRLRLVMAAGRRRRLVFILIVTLHPPARLAVGSALIAALGCQVEVVIGTDDGIEAARIRGVGMEDRSRRILVEDTEPGKLLALIPLLRDQRVV